MLSSLFVRASGVSSCDLFLSLVLVACYFFFFFQAEDGIRDHCVTGVQTCALPICGNDESAATMTTPKPMDKTPLTQAELWSALLPWIIVCIVMLIWGNGAFKAWARSEERRVGKECRARGSAEH